MKNNIKITYTFMIVPALIVASVLFFYPVIRTFYLSLYEYSPVFNVDRFNGLNNYFQIFNGSTFRLTILRTIIYTIGVVGADFLIGMGFALLTYKRFKGVKIVRTILTIPMLFIPAAAGITWTLLYNEDIGVINIFLRSIGLKGKMWLAFSNSALPAIMITDIWAWTPFMYLILLAGLQSLPLSPFEAAKVEGASSFQRFWYLTLPMLKPVITIGIIIKSLDTFRTFVYVWVMTRGGPGDASQVLSTLIYRKIFMDFNFGFGSSMAVVAFIFAFIIASLLIVIASRRE